MKLWDINNHSYRGTLLGATDQAVSSDYCESRDILAVASWDAKVRLYSLSSLPHAPTPDELAKYREENKINY